MSAISQDTFVVPGIPVSGTGGGGGGGGVTQLVAGNGINLSPAGGTGVVTVTVSGSAASSNASFSSITMSTTGSISNVGNLVVSSINGQIPNGVSATPNALFSSITMSTTGSIGNVGNLVVSSINGIVPGKTDSVLTVSTLAASSLMTVGSGATGVLTMQQSENQLYSYLGVQSGTIYIGDATEQGVGVGVSLAVDGLSNSNYLVVTETNTATSSMTVSSLNGTVGSLVNNLEFTNFPQDKFISSYAGNWGNAPTQFGSLGQFMSTIGAQVSPFISTVAGDRSITAGNIIMSASTNMAAGSPNAWMGIYGGGGRASGLFTNNVWSYPVISTMNSMNEGNNIDLNWIAGGGVAFGTSGQGPSTKDNTINYYLICSPDWPVTMRVQTSTLQGNIVNTDTINTTTTKLGKVSFV